MNRLPAEGVPGTRMNDAHCLAAADHARGNPDFVPAPAERERIERGEQLRREIES
jgi:hypothetical protein